MLKHIVMWKVKNDSNETQFKQDLMKFKERLEALKGFIPEIMELEVGIDINRSDKAFDILLYTVFKDAAALDTYQKHPEHVKVKDFITGLAYDRAVVDYLI
ncbi:MAG: Dabb family protein [Spirochaetes bacterium]|nr:Dabb family protein [Spirochaetota bacterium]